MKCDNCIHASFEEASQNCPHSFSWCAKGHWEGIDYKKEPGIDLWKDCEDFITRTECRGCGKLIEATNNGVCDECWSKGTPTNTEIEVIERIKERNKRMKQNYYTHEEMKKLLLEEGDEKDS